MKKLIAVIVTILVAGGIGIGYFVANRTDSTPASSNSSTSASNVVPAGDKVLDLSGKGITKVGPEVYGATNTTDLLLSNNSIRTLPSELGKMTKVTTFKIDHNVLEGSLIGEIRQMSRLKVLDVSYNNMTGMPAEIGQLSQLETLDYSYNKLNSLPNELANLKNSLKVFNLTGNPLSQSKVGELKTKLPNTEIIF